MIKVCTCCLPHLLGLHCVLCRLLGSARLVLDALKRIVVNLGMSPDKHIRHHNFARGEVVREREEGRSSHLSMIE
jgi:hypothetical protein